MRKRKNLEKNFKIFWKTPNIKNLKNKKSAIKISKNHKTKK